MFGFREGFFGHDDTLDAFGMHGLVGIAGAILTGVFAVDYIGGESGAIQGNWMQVVLQLKSLGATILYSAVMTFVVFKLVSLVTRGGRINGKIELEGMDIGYHGERKMTIDDTLIDKSSNSPI